MSLLDLLMDRNNTFVNHRFSPSLKINPSQKLMIIGCVDPRVDPTEVLGLELGEAAVIRNVGGRVTPATIRTIAMLGKVGQANGGGRPGVGWNLIVLHHTDCGMTDLASFPGLLAEYFEILAGDLAGKSISDPVGSVKVDVAALQQTGLPGPFVVTGLVYDVATGRVATHVPPVPLHAE